MKLFDLAERWKSLGLTGEKNTNFHTEIYISSDILQLQRIKCQKVKKEFKNGQDWEIIGKPEVNLNKICSGGFRLSLESFGRYLMICISYAAYDIDNVYRIDCMI